jgi:hypothetical protein
VFFICYSYKKVVSDDTGTESLRQKMRVSHSGGFAPFKPVRSITPSLRRLQQKIAEG